MEPRIEIPQELAARLAAFGINDLELQHNYRNALKRGVTDAQFVEQATHDVEQLEAGRTAAEKQREIDAAHQRQANRIAIAGMALPAIITAADHTKSVGDVARAALAHADALLEAADKTKDPILNG